MNWLASLASRASVPIFPAIGSQGQPHVQDLMLDPRIRWARSPRHARIMLVAGAIPPAFSEALRRIHDQLCGPAATVWLRSRPLPELADHAVVIDEPRQFPEIATGLNRALIRGERTGEPSLCPDEPPEPWEGLGDYGQGGEGMMGGTPYGRGMAMTADDLRDGLQLDPLSFSIGPFWPAFPPGFSAQMSLHGDVIAEIEVLSAPYPAEVPEIFWRALERPVPIAGIELARARYNLRQLSHSLWLNGLDSVSLCVLRRSQTLQSGDSVSGLYKWLRRSGFLKSAGAAQGVLSKEQAQTIGGSAARAAGIAADARQRDPRYQELGFRPITGQGSDCRSRWQQWLNEAEQSLSLTQRARENNLHTSVCNVVETPRGPLGPDSPPTAATSILPDILPGLEWSEAMATIASLDLAAVSVRPGENT